MIERIVTALTYPTMGMIGFIWLILGLITKARPRLFTMYHIYQSIFLSIAYVVISLLIGIIINMLSYVPLINKLVAQLVFWTNAPVFFGYSIIQTIVLRSNPLSGSICIYGKIQLLPVGFRDYKRKSQIAKIFFTGF